MDKRGNSRLTSYRMDSSGAFTFIRSIRQDDGTPGGDFMDGASNGAQFRSPIGVAVDDLGNVYVEDKDNHRIRKISIPQ